MRRRRPADEELLPLEIDGDDAPPDGDLVEVGPPAGRRRWRDAAVLLAAVALVAGIGLTGDGGTETADADPTTSTTRRRRPPRAPRTPRITTTTVPVGIPRAVPGTGPVLDGPTGSAVAFAGHDSEVTVLDLDSGGRCEVGLGRGTGAWVQRTDGIEALVHADGPMAVAADCSLRPLPAREAQEIFPTGDPDRYWSVEWGPGGMRLVEVDGEGTPVAEAIPLPGSNGAVRLVDGGVVVDVFGSATFIDRRSHTDRHLGHGTAIAAARDRIVLVECEGLRCDVVVRDLRGRELARVEHLQPTPGWEAAALSPDDRLLAVLVTQATELPWVTVVDLATGARHALVRTHGGPIAFTADGRYVVTTTGAGVVAAPVAGGEPTLLAPGAQSFVVLRSPAGAAAAA